MLRAGRAALVAALLATGTGACARHDPPAPDGSPSIALPELASAGAPAALPLSAESAASAPPSPSSPVDAAPASAAELAASPSAELPQTHDRPAASGAAFDARVAALWAGIVADDPAQAMPFFFPLEAYRQVKDVTDPASDWKHRLVAAYAHDVHALHARLRDDADRATLAGIDVPDARARWVDPGEEYNKLGYFRVFGSRLRYTVGDETRSVEVKSLISWRGEWYVVHLSAIK